MLRSVFAGVLGLVVMLLMVVGVEFIGHGLWPPPAGLNLEHPAAREAFVAMTPTAAKVWVLFAYAAASFLGAGTAATIAKAHKRGAAIVVGGVLTALVAVNFAEMLHPLWMMMGGVLLPLPFALLGWRVFR